MPASAADGAAAAECSGDVSLLFLEGLLAGPLFAALQTAADDDDMTSIGGSDNLAPLGDILLDELCVWAA
jgi:hypothetical protein